MLDFSPEIFGNLGKYLNKKAKVNFKMYDLTNWETNNYKAHIVQYLEK